MHRVVGFWVFFQCSNHLERTFTPNNENIVLIKFCFILLIKNATNDNDNHQVDLEFHQ